MTSINFKVGDRVTIKKLRSSEPFDWSFAPHTATTGTVRELSTRWPAYGTLAFVEQDGGDCQYVPLSNIELIPTEEVKVGDRVRIIQSENRAGHHFPVGTEAVITDVLGSGRYCANGTNRKMEPLSQTFRREDFDLIPAPAPVKAPAPAPRTFDLQSQNGRILAHLLGGNTITPLQAIGVFGAYRLAARIRELRLAGHKIKTSMKVDPNGKPYAEYSLRNAGYVAA
jgi:hypothetical protein